jgi:fucose permease
MVAESHFPRGLIGLAERFTVTAMLSAFKDHKPLAFRASLCRFLGITLGVYLFLANGVREIFKLSAS